jgi:hypothetical protein
MNTEIQLFNGLNSSDWLHRIYDISSASPPINELDCLNQCLNIQRTICNFFVFNDLTCFLGNYETFKIDISNSTFAGKNNASLKIVKGK